MSLDVEQLYRRYGDMVLGRCRSLLRNDAEAQEAMQEVFLRLHRYQDSFRGEASPTTYLYKITTTTCLNRMRTRRRKPEELYDEPPSIPCEDTMLTSTGTRELLQQVMGLADEGTQQALIHHYVDGMTHREVGEVLGISAAAVRKRISTFRNRLKNNPPTWLQEVDW